MVRFNSLFSIEKFESTELYCIINSSCNNKLTSQTYFEKKFYSKELDWRVIYMFTQKVTTNTHLRPFQYKIINNISYLNENLFIFGLSTTSSFSFWNSFNENITHFLRDCTVTQCLWKKIQLKLKDDITLLQLTPQAAIFSFLEANYQCNLIQNHIHLISKLYIYKSGKKNW